jgi:pyruvate dehydrogenase E1 component
VLLAACGAIVPEVLEAARILSDDEGVEATVLCLSSPARLYRGWQTAATAPVRGGPAREPSHLERLIHPDERGLPVVTVIDGASHALAFVGSALGAKCVPLGVDRFGQTGSQPEVYAEYGISAAAIVTAALVALEPS